MTRGPVPEPLGFIALRPEWMNYTIETGTEDRATQGCAPSAASSAGMPTGGCPSGRPNARTTTRRTLAYSKRKMVLTTGSTLHRAPEQRPVEFLQTIDQRRKSYLLAMTYKHDADMLKVELAPVINKQR